MLEALLLALLGVVGCTAGDPPAPAHPPPLEVVATAGRSFALVAPAMEGELPETWEWTRLRAEPGGWVVRDARLFDAPRPFTVISPTDACVGSARGTLRLASEIGIRDGRTEEVGEIWDAVEIEGCPSFDGDRRVGFEGLAGDAKWVALGPDYAGAETPGDPVRAVGMLRRGGRTWLLLESTDGHLAAVDIDRGGAR